MCSIEIKMIRLMVRLCGEGLQGGRAGCRIITGLSLEGSGVARTEHQHHYFETLLAYIKKKKTAINNKNGQFFVGSEGEKASLGSKSPVLLAHNGPIAARSLRGCEARDV